MRLSVIGTICVAIALLGTFSLSVKAQNSTGKKLLTPVEFQQRLKGPILSIPTPFTESYEINYKGLEQMINPALRYECKIVALTSGNSKYDKLTYDEVRELTRFVIETVGDRAMTIAASGTWDKEQVLDYVRYAELLGASAVQVQRPNYLDTGSSIQETVQFYQSVAENTRLAIVLHGYYSVELLNELVKIKSIVAMKEDVSFPYYVTRQILFGDRLSVFGGGNDGRYLHGYPYGSPAYYSSLYTYAPEMGQKFWKAIQNKDMKTATDILMKYDFPFIEKFSFPLWSAAIEYFGGPARYIRPAIETLPDEEIKKMHQLFNSMGLKPASKYNSVSVSKGIFLPVEWARGGHVGGIVDGNIVVAGGNNWSKDKTQKYWLKNSAVFKDGAWVQGPSLPKPLAYAMYSTDDSGLYVAGGTEDGESVSRDAYQLTSLNGRAGWQALPKLPQATGYGGGAVLDGKFYVACGSIGKTNTNKMWVLDLKNPNGKWQQCPSLPGEERMFPSLVASGKYLYLLGGLSNSSLPLKDAYRYDPGSRKWTKLSDLPLKGYAWSSQPIDENYLIITGRADDSKPFTIHDGIWLIDLTDMSMKKVGKLIAPSTTSPLIKVSEKKWWVVGGEPDSKLNRTERVSVINLE